MSHLANSQLLQHRGYLALLPSWAVAFAEQSKMYRYMNKRPQKTPQLEQQTLASNMWRGHGGKVAHAS